MQIMKEIGCTIGLLQIIIQKTLYVGCVNGMSQYRKGQLLGMFLRTFMSLSANSTV